MIEDCRDCQLFAIIINKLDNIIKDRPVLSRTGPSNPRLDWDRSNKRFYKSFGFTKKLNISELHLSDHVWSDSN